MEKLNMMLDSGLRVYFLSRDFIQVIVGESAIWWHGKTIDDVYEVARLRGYVGALHNTVLTRASCRS